MFLESRNLFFSFLQDDAYILFLRSHETIFFLKWFFSLFFVDKNHEAFLFLGDQGSFFKPRVVIFRSTRKTKNGSNTWKKNVGILRIVKDMRKAYWREELREKRRKTSISKRVCTHVVETRKSNMWDCTVEMRIKRQKKKKKGKRGEMGKNVSRESRIGVACPVVLLYFSFETWPEVCVCVRARAYVYMHVYSGSIFLARTEGA